MTAKVIYDYFGFIYIWFDRKHKMFYLGSHLGNTEDGYICSSKRMKAAYKLRPEDFKRRIIFLLNVRDHSLLLKEETRWLKMIKKEELGQKYYNYMRHGWSVKNGHWEIKTSREGHIENMRRSWTPARKIAHGEMLKNKWKNDISFQEKQKQHPHPPMSEDGKRRVRLASKNRKISEETRAKMKASASVRCNTPEHIENFKILMRRDVPHNFIPIPLGFKEWFLSDFPTLKQIEKRYDVCEGVVLRWKKELDLIGLKKERWV